MQFKCMYQNIRNANIKWITFKLPLCFLVFLMAGHKGTLTILCRKTMRSIFGYQYIICWKFKTTYIYIVFKHNDKHFPKQNGIFAFEIINCIVLNFWEWLSNFDFKTYRMKIDVQHKTQKWFTLLFLCLTSEMSCE